MKIGLVCPYNMFQFAGGVQEIVLQLQTSLQKKGHKVLIITPRPRAHDGNIPKDMLLVGRSAKMNTPFSTMVDFSVEADGDEIDLILSREKFDVLHFHEPWVPVLSRQILTRSRSVNVATFHAKLPETVMSKSIMNAVTPYTKSVLNYLHAYTAVSDAAAEYVRSVTDEDVAIVPNGLDIERFKNVNNTKKPTKIKTILYLGRLEKRKGVEYLLKAYVKLRQAKKNVKLIIAGSGVKRKSLEKYVEQNNIPGVTFKGFVSEKQKIKLLQSADVYCSPALFGESFGIVLLEAMAVGTPVVAGNNSGYSSVMTGRGKISLVDPKNTIDFVNRLELMIYDDEIRELWRVWASQNIDFYNFEKIANGYEAIYKKALKAHA